MSLANTSAPTFHPVAPSIGLSGHALSTPAPVGTCRRAGPAVGYAWTTCSAASLSPT